MNIAFAGFKHNHIIVVYKEAALSSDINIVGAWEKEEKYRNAAREEGVKFTYETYEELLADVSYAAPDSQGYSTPLYWTFDIWGTKGVLRFSDQCEAMAYLNGETEGISLADTPLPHSELADFLAEIRGEKEVLLDTKNVLY